MQLLSDDPLCASVSMHQWSWFFIVTFSVMLAPCINLLDDPVPHTTFVMLLYDQLSPWFFSKQLQYLLDDPVHHSYLPDDPVLRSYLLDDPRPRLHQQVECGGDKGQADVVDHLNLPRGHRDCPLFQVHLRTEQLFFIWALRSKNLQWKYAAACWLKMSKNIKENALHIRRNHVMMMVYLIFQSEKLTCNEVATEITV